jgi:hypothetical protein
VTTVQVGSAYTEYVESMERLMAGDGGRNRQRVLRAYFTGVVPNFVFEYLEREVPRPERDGCR